MSEAEFSALALKICVGGLVIFLGFIIWNLGKESKVRSEERRVGKE